MNYAVLIFAVLWVAPGALRAQRVHFEKDSLTQVYAKARQQNKPVLVVLAPPPSPADLPPALKKARRESGLNAPAVAAVLNKDFLNKELAFGTAESAAVAGKYTVSRYPTYLYFNPDGGLLYRNVSDASAEQRYLKDLQAVREARADPQNLSYFRKEFQQGNRSAAFLKQYIAKRRQLGQLVEPELLDAYVKQLPVKVFDQAAEVVFILENGPVVGSRAYQLARLNTKVYDSLYKFLPLPQRVAVNNLIIRNTITQAIGTKDRNLAAQGAEFARRSWNNDFAHGSRAYENNMLRFYGSTKDTANYLRQAVSFYDRYYMTIPADSASKAVAALHTFRQEQRAARQRLAKAAVAPAGDNFSITTAAVRPAAVGGPPASFLQGLNNGAWAIYQTGTHNSQYLVRAMLWSRRTVDLDPAAYNYDTLAHVLYRLRLYHEAEAMQQQAVAAARQEKTSATAYQQELQKMKQRTL